MGGKEKLPKHGTLSNLDTNKLIVGSIRNPWDWYVSLYSFGCLNKGGMFHKVTTKNIKNIYPFLSLWLRNKPYFLPLMITDVLKYVSAEIKKPTEYWKNCYDNANNKNNFRKWLKTVLTNNKRKRDWGTGYGSSKLSKFCGLASYQYCYLFCKNFLQPRNFKSIDNIDKLKKFERKNNALDYIIHTESLEHDFIILLEKLGYKVNSNMFKLICKGKKKKTNPSKHQPSSYYYDKETINLVAKKEELIIEKYGYTHPNL